MSIIFKNSLCRDERERRIMANQWNQLKDFRSQGHESHKSMLALTNAGRIPGDAYREMDPTTKIEPIKRGEFALLTRAMQVSKPVDIGTYLLEIRQASEAGQAQSSMSGQKGVKLDEVDYKYQGAIVPIHDVGYGRSWRELQSMRKEGFDALVDDSREAEKTLMRKMNDYMWNGNANLVFKGTKWLGIKADPTVANATLTVDLADPTVSATDIRDEIRRVRDILLIANRCTGELALSVSPEIASNFERVFSTAEGIFGTIADMVMRLRGVVEIVEDSELVGNQIAFTYLDAMEGFHPVTGMAISSYAMRRDAPNDDFNYMKWAAMGFMSRNSYSGFKCALYAAGA